MKVGIFDNEPLDLSIAANIIAGYGTDEGALIPALQDVQDAYGYVPEEVSGMIAEGMRIPESQVFGVLTFYAQFRSEPRGKYIVRICRGTACHVRGAQILIEELKGVLGLKGEGTTADGLFTFEEVACIGACGLAPVMLIEADAFGNLSAARVGEIMDEFRKKEIH